jgi:hypothetical protein
VDGFTTGTGGKIGLDKRVGNAYLSNAGSDRFGPRLRI